MAGEKTSLAENDVFLGAGYLARWVNDRHPDCLALPLDIKKVYCDEMTGEACQFTMDQLADGLHSAIQRTSRHYCEKFVSGQGHSQIG